MEHYNNHNDSFLNALRGKVKFKMNIHLIRLLFHLNTAHRHARYGYSGHVN